jgi:hypothetical protein
MIENMICEGTDCLKAALSSDDKPASYGCLNKKCELGEK